MIIKPKGYFTVMKKVSFITVSQQTCNLRTLDFLIYNQRWREAERSCDTTSMLLLLLLRLIYWRAAERQQTEPRLVFWVILGSLAGLSWRPKQLREIRLLDIFMKFSFCSHRVAVGLRVNSSAPAAFFSGRFLWKCETRQIYHQNFPMCN